MQFETYPFEKLNLLLEGISPDESHASLALTIGEPQFETPAFIQEMLASHTHLLNKYPKTAGEKVLVDSMIEFVDTRFGVTLTNRQLLPVNGTREVLFNFPSFLRPKKMAFPNPFYQIYEGAAIACGSAINYMPLTKEKKFLQDPCDLEGDEEFVIINTPNNPTDSVMDLDTLCGWVELALGKNFVLLSDECYSEIYFDEKPPSLLEASLKVGNKNFKNILVINSISKRSSAPSLRSGFIAGDEEILKEYLLYRTYVGCASPLPLQITAAEAWREESHVEKFREKYRKNFEIAQEILGIKLPKGGFYLWLEVNDDIAFTKFAYERYNIKVMPGTYMSRQGVGSGYIRVALVYDEEKTRESLIKLKEALDGFNQRVV